MRCAERLGQGQARSVRPGQRGRDHALEHGLEGREIRLKRHRSQHQGPEGEMPDQDVIGEVREFLSGRIAACIDAGIAASQILVDPGFGFGKSLEHNLFLLRNLNQLTALGHPLLVGLARKSLIGKITGRDVDQRLAGSLALALLAARNGASIFRVHDVAETVDALKIVTAYTEQSPG